MTVRFDVYRYKSPWGALYCVFDGPFLAELAIKERPLSLEMPPLSSIPPLTGPFAVELDRYFEGTLERFSQRVKFVMGTPFEQRVWRALGRIPYGETRSYKWIAEQAGSPAGFRAAGQALGKNPLPIIVPCHRVVAADGSVGGFSCGIEVKQWLLEHEKTSKKQEF